jgi:tetratricopeptide (TPR) repeat protein
MHLDTCVSSHRSRCLAVAQGVQGAAVVICFLSQQYQLSENCKLELKFACQTGIPIVPVMLEDDRAEGWRPSEWLGVITAGALWTPLSADSGFDQSITNLIVQLQAGIGSTFTDMSLSSTDQKFQEEFQEEEGGAHEKEKASMSSATVIPAEYVVATVVADDDMFTMDEMREELERLRAESHQSGTHLTRGAGEECALPAMLPEARDGLVVSDSMHKLVDTVISVTSKRCCGFWGSGGIGKTTTSAWLCRQERVRRHFDLIVWLTLSQTPNVLACQRQLFTQLTGQELAQELSEEDRVVAIQEAFLGKHCLLVLDDCWDVGHLSHFALVDESTRSRVLISSRVVSTLENCEVVDIGLPTEQDAIQIVMAAAGMANGAAVPEEAREVARLCKLLPLTLGIAGRLIKGLELQHDWSEVVAMMKEELSVDGEARSAEDGVIATSLRAIKGRDADSARALFKAFRLVPEDVKIPLEALACVYEASNAAEEATAASSSGSDGGGGSSPRGPSGPPTMLQLRKWTKLLIERCLVLGPIDQPSLHDMVGDFSSSMSSQEVTCAAHRRLVNLFRERRPEPAGWDELETEGRLAKYVIKHCGCHISASWMPDWRSDEEAISWLEDFKISQDAIPFAAAQFLGTERVSELARESEGKADWWSASLRWSATALENRVSAGTHVSQPLFQACAAALEHHQPTTPEGIDAKQRLELTTIFGVLTNWDANAVSTYLPRLNALQDSAAAKANPDTLAAVFLMNEFSLEFWSVERKGAGTASELRFGKQSFQYMNYFIEAAQAEPVGSRKRNKLLALAFAMNVGTSFQDMMIESMLNSGGPDAHEPSPDGIWDRAFGAGGCLLNEASMVYDYESHHKILLSTQSWDGCLRPSHVLALYLRWGDLANANANAEKALRNFKRFMTQSSPDGNTQMFTLAEWPSMLYLLGRSEDVVEFMRENRVDWSHAAETALAIGQVTSFVGQMETEGPTKSGMFNDSRDWVWTCKSIWLLAAMATTTAANGTQTEEELAEQTEQFLDTLPAADELARFGIWRDQDGQPRFHAARGMLNITSLVWPALVLETLGQGEKALAYATQALNVDHTTGGGNGAPLRTLAHRCCGRVLAGQGKMDEARAAFEAAEALAAKRGYWMLEALARRDLLEHVSTPAAGGELELAGGGQQKKLLAPLVARLTGPKEALAELLGKDYVELL